MTPEQLHLALAVQKAQAEGYHSLAEALAQLLKQQLNQNHK